MEKLPSDIMLDILSRLPHETMINYKLVCKPWRDIASNIKVGLLFQFGRSRFKLCYGGEQYDDIDMHGNYSYKTSLVEIDSHWSIDHKILFFMIGSCSGLVCFSKRGKSPIGYDPIYICNPITKEYVYLPTDNHDETWYGKSIGYFNCGFGYHQSTDEYKVVRIKSERDGQVQVYTLGSGHGWRDIGRNNYGLGYYGDYLGVFANGALHWTMPRGSKTIMTFDLADEEFRLIPLPAPLSSIRYLFSYYLKLLGGYLCVLHIDEENDDKFIHIWALEKKKKFSSFGMKHGMKFDDSCRWSKKFSVPCTKDYKPIAVTKNNQVLMSHYESVFCYDSETKTLRKLWDDSPMKIIQAIPHVH